MGKQLAHFIVASSVILRQGIFSYFSYICYHHSFVCACIFWLSFELFCICSTFRSMSSVIRVTRSIIASNSAFCFRWSRYHCMSLRWYSKTGSSNVESVMFVVSLPDNAFVFSKTTSLCRFQENEIIPARLNPNALVWLHQTLNGKNTNHYK